LAAKHADATEWPQLRELNWTAVAEHAPRVVVVDTRNPLDPAVVSDARFDLPRKRKPRRVSDSCR
jgi:UDPglucose 6-dehydrogenase